MTTKSLELNFSYYQWWNCFSQFTFNKVQGKIELLFKLVQLKQLLVRKRLNWKVLFTFKFAGFSFKFLDHVNLYFSDHKFEVRRQTAWSTKTTKAYTMCVNTKGQLLLLEEVILFIILHNLTCEFIFEQKSNPAWLQELYRLWHDLSTGAWEREGVPLCPLSCPVPHCPVPGPVQEVPPVPLLVLSGGYPCPVLGVPTVKSLVLSEIPDLV